MLSRRELLQRLVGVGLVAATPPVLRRYWQLDRTMVDPWFLETGRFDATLRDFEKITLFVSLPGDGIHNPGSMSVNGKVWPRRRDMETNDGRWIYAPPTRGVT